jgi:TPP-dependent indolepyruvate ferredoxin oxidoreductase alpha subunit
LDPAARRGVSSLPVEEARPSPVRSIRADQRPAPLTIEPARCNRCGACRRLGCGAIGDDEVGEALVIDGAACDGCGRCAPVCRGKAIGAAE